MCSCRRKNLIIGIQDQTFTNNCHQVLQPLVLNGSLLHAFQKSYLKHTVRDIFLIDGMLRRPIITYWLQLTELIQFYAVSTTMQ